MATEAYSKKELLLQDGTEVTVKPLAIGRLRRFQSAWEKFGEVKSDDEGFTVFINCAGISLEHEFKGKFDSLRAPAGEDGFLSEEYREYLESVLDLDTIYVVLEVAGGLKLNDPKLMEAALEIVAEQAGKN